MTPIEFGRKVRELIEKGWTQDVYARDAIGNRCGQHDDVAVCFCLRGAMYRLVDSGCESYYRKFQMTMVGLLGGDPFHGSIVSFNDAEGRTQAEVLDLIDRTIARLQALELAT